LNGLDEAIKDDYSFMSTNMEPIVNNLFNSTNSANFLNKVDVNLLNPYRDIEFNKKNPISLSKQANHHNQHYEDLDNVQQLIKNETIRDLSKMKDPIIDFPGTKKNFENMKNNFRFNFKQKDSIFDQFSDKKDSKMDKVKKIKLKSDKKRSESVNKMLENFSNQNMFVNKLKSNHDKNKLFLNDFPHTIELIDDYNKAFQ
jgi:hypothetical protein